MAIVTGYTVEKMNEFNNASVVGGAVNSAGSLILETRGGTDIDAGNVRGPVGNTGPAGATGIAGGTTATRNTIYPLPTTAAATVALANKVVTFYNTTTKMFETYYAKTGTAGLTVPGVSGSSGWYENLYTAQQPKGLISISEITASTSPSVATVVVNSIPYFTFKANRWYEVEYSCAVTNKTGASNTGISPLVQIHTCATADSPSAISGLTELMGWNLSYNTNEQTARANPKRKIVYPVDTTLQVKATLSGNNSTCYIYSGVNFPQQLTVSDLGVYTVPGPVQML